MTLPLKKCLRSHKLAGAKALRHGIYLRKEGNLQVSAVHGIAERKDVVRIYVTVGETVGSEVRLKLEIAGPEQRREFREER